MIEDKENRYFHVTPAKNLDSILKNGLEIRTGERSLANHESQDAVFLFPSFSEMENALYNWLGAEFEDEDDLIIFQIDIPKGFPVYRNTDSNGELMYEAYTYENIPPAYITAVYDERYELINEGEEKA